MANKVDFVEGTGGGVNLAGGLEGVAVMLQCFRKPGIFVGTAELRQLRYETPEFDGFGPSFCGGWEII